LGGILRLEIDAGGEDPRRVLVPESENDLLASITLAT
jgi:hypothetical protein